MKYRTLTPKEMAYAQEQLSSRSIEEDTAYWYFPEKMKAKVKRNFPIAFEGSNTAYYPDFVLFNELIIIEIDGGYHKRQKQIDRDETKSSMITALLLSVLKTKTPVSTYRFGKGS